MHLPNFNSNTVYVIYLLFNQSIWTSIIFKSNIITNFLIQILTATCFATEIDIRLLGCVCYLFTVSWKTLFKHILSNLSCLTSTNFSNNNKHNILYYSFNNIVFELKNRKCFFLLFDSQIKFVLLRICLTWKCCPDLAR